MISSKANAPASKRRRWVARACLYFRLLLIGYFEGIEFVKEIERKGVATEPEIWTPEGPGDASTFWQTSGAAGRAIYLKRQAAL